MKKSIIALCVAVALGLSACGNSVESKIEKVDKLAGEYFQLLQESMKGNSEAGEKAEEVSRQIEKICKELEKEDLTQEQKEELAKAMLHHLADM